MRRLRYLCLTVLILLAAPFPVLGVEQDSLKLGVLPYFPTHLEVVKETSVMDPGGFENLPSQPRPLSANSALDMDGFWSQIPPPSRSGHTAIYDPIRDRMLVFGGYQAELSNDTWSLCFGEKPGWQLLETLGEQPPGLREHSAIYDPVRDRMILFGGRGGKGFLNETWELSLGDRPTWSRLQTHGDLPIARHSHAALYDPVRDRMIVFGGFTYDGHC